MTIGDSIRIRRLTLKMTQADLSQGVCADGITDYFLSMASQPVIVAVEDGRCLGFMAFKLDHTCDQIGPDKLPNFYASTCVVHPETRGRVCFQTLRAAGSGGRNRRDL